MWNHRLQFPHIPFASPIHRTGSRMGGILASFCKIGAKFDSSESYFSSDLLF